MDTRLVSSAFALSIFLSAIISISSVGALQCQLPDAYYGSLTLLGMNAPAGTDVRAMIDGEVKGSYTTTTAGIYGQLTGDDKLYVYCDNDGQTIIFEVMAAGSWRNSGETAKCVCGSPIQQLDINVEDMPDVDHDGDGFTLGQGDCDDNDPKTYPGAMETCDGKDNDCDNDVDEDDALCTGSDFTIGECGYSPDDNPYTLDTYQFTSQCIAGVCTEPPAQGWQDMIEHLCDESCGAVCIADEDCDQTACDADGCYQYRYLDYPDFVDGVCDGCVCLEGECDYEYAGTDADSDNFDLECGDCNDSDKLVYPGAEELCDLKDNDCDGEIDEGCLPPVSCTDDSDCGIGEYCSGDICIQRPPYCDLFMPVMLESGWNLIGFPSCNEVPVAQAVGMLNGNCIEIFALVDGQWLSYTEGVPDELQTLQTISPLQGIYIHVKDCCDLIVE